MSSDPIPAEVERWTKELRKGSTKLALLTLLGENESYGYEILTNLKTRAGEQAAGATEATVYPLLHDLEERGFLRSRWRANEPGVPPRKYYALTREGQLLLEALRESWSKYRSDMDRWVGGGR